ncbi:MAG TPA: M56 family metallopeptidase [Bacillota bacterium]|nr:M56 family metallopeptidase [Bacillota bacterium]
MEGVFLSVLNMSLTASYVIAVIALVRLFLKKAPKAISYMLWAAAGFRLVLPFSFKSVFSLIPFKSVPIPVDIAMQPIPRVDSGIAVVDNAVNRVLPAATPVASANPLQIWQAAGAYIWLAGIAVMLFYSVISVILLNRQLRGAVLSERNIYEAENLKTPFVLGLIRPKIYIPTGLSPEERSCIILHEETHIKRFDHVVKMFAFLVLCVHWFNPLVWAAFILMSSDMEMSCDEKVLKEMDSGIKKVYSTSLISMATGRRPVNGSPLAFGEGNIKGRIKNILNFKKPEIWVIAVSVALVVVLCIGLTANKTSGENLVPADEIQAQIARADVNQDGKDESIYLDKSQIEANSATLLVKDAGGSEIWSETLNLSHVGWDELFLAKLDGKQYLLRYNPGMFQGICTYTFSLFSPEKGGKENVLRTEKLEFDVNGTEALDARKMIDFASEINALLKNSTLLVSSNGGSWSFGPSSAEPFFERYSWMDDNPELYKDGDSLETKLEKYSEYTTSNRKLSDILYNGYTSSHSDKFSEEEIRDAMESVIAKFGSFKGCELTKLWYDEEKSNNQIKSYMTGGRGSVNGVSEGNVIVVYSDFSVDSSGGDGSLNPNSTYTDWCWILIRDSGKGEWKVDDWGY